MKITSTSITEGQPIELAYAHADAGGKNINPSSVGHPAQRAPSRTPSPSTTLTPPPDQVSGTGFSPISRPTSPLGEGGPLPAEVREWTNDYQEEGYSGACPPPGPAHRYIHTVHAMPTEHLDIPDEAANVQVRFAIHTTELDSASITGTFQQS